MKVFYTHKAVDDLKRLHEFIAVNNPRAALEASKKLQQAIKRLIDFPLLGKKVKSSYKSLALCDLVADQYIIRYAVLSKEIHILRVWHGKEKRP